MSELTRLNFVALVTVLAELARDDLAAHDPALYENLERNQRGVWADVVVRGGRVLQPGTDDAYRADLAFDSLRGDRAAAGCDPAARSRSRIVEVGDARFLAAGREVEAADALIAAPLAVGVEGWAARRWLQASVLEELARWGVGELEWAVPRRRLAAAERLARELAGAGRSRLTPVARGGRRPGLRLTGRPRGGPPASLAELAARLGGGGALSELWRRGGTTLRPGAPASLVLISPWNERHPDPASAAVTAVWLDGVEVER